MPWLSLVAITLVSGAALGLLGWLMRKVPGWVRRKFREGALRIRFSPDGREWSRNCYLGLGQSTVQIFASVARHRRWFSEDVLEASIMILGPTGGTMPGQTVTLKGCSGLASPSSDFRSGSENHGARMSGTYSPPHLLRRGAGLTFGTLVEVGSRCKGEIVLELRYTSGETHRFPRGFEAG